jgi:hypothetical protein
LGRSNGIQVIKLSDKLGARKMPTAELALDGTKAELVGDSDGIRSIAPMLNIIRAWSAVSSVALMRRGLALARDYARKRSASGTPLARKPLHVDLLAGLQAEMEGAFHLAFAVVALIGKDEAGELQPPRKELVRALIPIAKLTAARQAVAVLSEIVESFGGAGYVEDTGIPQLLRDAQVFPIWEGTTNVLALETLRAVQDMGGLGLIRQEALQFLSEVREPGLGTAAESVKKALTHAEEWYKAASKAGEAKFEAGARRFALTLGRSLELACLLGHAQWSLVHERDGRSAAAARRFSSAGMDLICETITDDAVRLAGDTAD